MPKDKRSFFERLTGSVDIEDAEEEIGTKKHSSHSKEIEKNLQKDEWLNGNDEGQLTVDVMQTPDEIIIQSTVAGVKPDELDVTITQDMVTIKGSRKKSHEVSSDDYFMRELYWGKFSRSIVLPQEIDEDRAEATLKNGLLTIKLPKLDKNRVQKLKIKNE